MNWRYLFSFHLFLSINAIWLIPNNKMNLGASSPAKNSFARISSFTISTDAPFSSSSSLFSKIYPWRISSSRSTTTDKKAHNKGAPFAFVTSWKIGTFNPSATSSETLFIDSYPSAFKYRIASSWIIGLLASSFLERRYLSRML